MGVVRQYKHKEGTPVATQHLPALSHKDYKYLGSQETQTIEQLRRCGSLNCLREPLIYPNGDLHGCLSPELVIGNILKEPLKAILKRFDSNPVYQLLRQQYVPGISLYAKFLEIIGKNTIDNKFSSGCELCLFLQQEYIPQILDCRISGLENALLTALPEYFPFVDNQRILNTLHNEFPITHDVTELKTAVDQIFHKCTMPNSQAYALRKRVEKRHKKTSGVSVHAI